jgi:hypothetical protein
MNPTLSERAADVVPLEDAADLILTAFEYAAAEISEASALATAAAANMMASNETLTGPTVSASTIEEFLVLLRQEGLSDYAARIEAAIAAVEGVPQERL